MLQENYLSACNQSPCSRKMALKISSAFKSLLRKYKPFKAPNPSCHGLTMHNLCINLCLRISLGSQQYLIREPPPHLIRAFSPGNELSLGSIYSCPPNLPGKAFRPLERAQSTNPSLPTKEMTLSGVLAWITSMNGSSTNSTCPK